MSKFWILCIVFLLLMPLGVDYMRGVYSELGMIEPTGYTCIQMPEGVAITFPSGHGEIFYNKTCEDLQTKQR